MHGFPLARASSVFVCCHVLDARYRLVYNFSLCSFMPCLFHCLKMCVCVLLYFTVYVCCMIEIWCILRCSCKPIIVAFLILALKQPLSCYILYFIRHIFLGFLYFYCKILKFQRRKYHLVQGNGNLNSD